MTKIAETLGAVCIYIYIEKSNLIRLRKHSFFMVGKN